ncbi:MAG: O-antigen ligase family protein [Rhodothermales bacterium]
MHESALPSEIAFVKWSRRLLGVAFGLGLFVIVAATLLAPTLVPYVPLGILGTVAGVWLFRHPSLNLLLVLALFPLIAGFEEGVDLGEFAFGVYFATYLASWYFGVIFLERTPLVRTFQDRMVVFLFLWVTGFVLISFIFGAEPVAIRNEYIPFMMLGFYFPVKRMCADERGVRALLILLLWMGLYVTVRNYLTLQQIISKATQVWQITQKGRAESNEILLLCPAFAMLTWASFTRTALRKTVLFALFLFITLGLVLTQSRGYWAGAAVGGIVMLFVLDKPRRIQLITMASIGIALAVGLVVLLFGGRSLLLTAGLWNRVSSIGPTVVSDISLINRWLESKVVWGKIVENPILGYGMGVPYEYYNLTISGTMKWSFIHNGYLSMWYRFGIVGFVVSMVIWVTAIAKGIRIARITDNRYRAILCVLATSVLCSMLVSAITSGPFYQMDTLLVLTMLFAFVSAAADATKETSTADKNLVI